MRIICLSYTFLWSWDNYLNFFFLQPMWVVQLSTRVVGWGQVDTSQLSMLLVLSKVIANFCWRNITIKFLLSLPFLSFYRLLFEWPNSQIPDRSAKLLKTLSVLMTLVLFSSWCDNCAWPRTTLQWTSKGHAWFCKSGPAAQIRRSKCQYHLFFHFDYEINSYKLFLNHLAHYYRKVSWHSIVELSHILTPQVAQLVVLNPFRWHLLVHLFLKKKSTVSTVGEAIAQLQHNGCIYLAPFISWFSAIMRS